MIKQVRTKSNAYSTVKYDKYGNILTPSRKRELKKAKEEPIKGPESIKIISQYPSTCSACNVKIPVGTQILWNKKNKNTKHVNCVSKYKKVQTMTEDEILLKIKNLQTPKGGFTKAGLASIGVPWPPPKGWKQRLLDNATDSKCSHTWYMREPGIECTKCGDVWQN